MNPSNLIVIIKLTPESVANPIKNNNTAKGFLSFL